MTGTAMKLLETENAFDTDRDAARQRERWVAFAFTASDLLVEATADGVIHFAAGPFRIRFGAGRVRAGGAGGRPG